MKRLLFALVLIVVVGVPVIAQQRPADPRFDIQVTEEMVRHSRILDALYFAGFIYGLGVLLFLLATRVSARLRDKAAAITRRPFLLAMLYVALFSIVEAVLELPLSYYAGFMVPHQFDLSNQTFAAWLWEETKGLLIGIALGSVIGALALLALRRFKRWWVPLWLGSIPIMILLIVVAPVFIDPLFNKFEPLKDQVLKQKLLDEASRAGIEGGRVYEVDKSKQTKTMNAYVTGIGPTKRIVMWDTLLAKMNHDEILAVMGHEMGHYVLNHLWQGLAWAIALSLVICWMAQAVYDRGLARWGGRWGVTERGDPASLPWLLIIVSIVSFLLSPLMNGISRHMEHQSDIFTLELTHLNEPTASAFVKLATDSKINPRPHPFIEFWRYSHPSIARRVDFVLGYKPWEEGRPNQLWRAK